MILRRAIEAHQAGSWGEAEALYRQSLGEGEGAVALGNLGALLSQRGRPQEALPFLQRAKVLAPGDPGAAANLGIALASVGRLEEARLELECAEALDPHAAVHPFNLGRALALLGLHAEAEAAARRALARDPAHPGARYNLALARLRLGRWREAWPDYETRFLIPEGPQAPHPQLRPWQGEALRGPLLLYGDQGYGDTLMAVRFLPRLQERGLELLLQVEPALHRLLAANFPGLILLPPGPVPEGLAAKAALLSLPGILDLRPEDLPGPWPYLRPPEEPAGDALDAWFAHLPPGPRVALCWRGNPAHLQDGRRSMDPTLLAPLAALEGVCWLAFNPGAGPPPTLPRIRDASPLLRDFAEAARALARVDLLVSVDTAPAHLAGALGRPGHLLLPFVPDWRWLLDRADCPWYPSLRLWRQERPGDWAQVVENLGAALR